MPIVRTYGCPNCNLLIEVTLDADQWDAAPPACPACAQRDMQQEFKPVAITGSHATRALDLAHEIASEDYHVADMQRDPRRESKPTVRYKDQRATTSQSSSWQLAQGVLETAIAAGRDTRVKYGSPLSVLQENLRTGAEPDLIANSKKRMIKVW